MSLNYNYNNYEKLLRLFYFFVSRPGKHKKKLFLESCPNLYYICPYDCVYTLYIYTCYSYAESKTILGVT